MDQRTRLTPAGDSAVARLRELIEAARTVVPFSGAGISTECGIPDFRSPGGIWTRYRPIQFEDFLASREMRDESWRRRFAMEEQFSTARPGRGHLALAGLYRAGKVPAVIPQNINNLRRAWAIPDAAVAELHGNTTRGASLDCARRYELAWVRERFTAGGASPDCGD